MPQHNTLKAELNTDDTYRSPSIKGSSSFNTEINQACQAGFTHGESTLTAPKHCSSMIPEPHLSSFLTPTVLTTYSSSSQAFLGSQADP